MNNPNENIYTALKPILVFSKIFGLCSNKIQIAENLLENYDYDDILDASWSIFVLVFLTLYTACTMKIGGLPALTSKLMIEIGNVLHLTISLLNAFIIGLFTIIKRKKFSLFLRKLHKFDNKMKEYESCINLKIAYFAARKYIFSATAIVNITMILYTVFDVVLFLENVSFLEIGAEVVTYVYPLMSMNIMVLQFGTLALIIQQRFKWINLHLQKIKENWEQNVRNNPPLYSKQKIRFSLPAIRRKIPATEELENLRHRHYELWSISQLLNNIYNFPILMTVLNLFISITFTMYFYFISKSKAKRLYPLLYSIYYILNGFINCTLLIGMITVSSRTKKEAKLAGDILHSIYDRTEELENSIAQFSIQLLQNHVEFSACRVFPLDEIFLFSVIGGITTYLLIVVQFQYQQT